MAYIAGFDHDVFISFAHVDNEPQDAGAPGWVTRFAGDLERRLARLVGRSGRVEIWRDPRLLGNHSLQDAIEEACLKSAVIVSITSPGYIASDWCWNRELKKFVTRADPRFGIKVGHCSRVFRVGCLRLNEAQEGIVRGDEDRRFLLETTLGFDFFEWDAEQQRDLPLRRTREDDADQRYWQKIDDIARGILETLGKMAQPVLPPMLLSPGVSGSKTTGDPPVGGPVIYVAQVADDLVDERAQLVRELEARGMQVLPRQPLPSEQPALSQTVETLLRAAQTVVHLFGRFYGLVPAGEQRSVAHVQYEVAQAHLAARGTPCPQIVWLPPELDRASCPPAQRDFLLSLESTPQTRVPEILQTGIEQLKEAVLRRLAPPTLPPGGGSGDHRPLVYIACPPEDAQLAQTIRDFLTSEKNDVMVELAFDDEKTRLKHFRRHVGVSDGLLILYGNAQATWVVDRVMVARQIAERRRKHALRVRGVYEAPPPERIDLGLSFEDWVFINCRTGHSNDDLRRFVTGLRNLN